ncbi:MAG: pyrroline-5-carboxylate reductase [Candidatus Caenarcaniphilales bacterium]|nr:pyrroline-5-carboxylate reductase [Candidatus Caenarcaniphilales bacterium]
MSFMGLIGCGNLGSAMLERWLENGADPKLIKVVDNHQERIEQLKLKPYKLEELTNVDVLVVAVKPWNVEEVLSKVPLDPETIVVPMAAGVSLKKLAKMLPEKQPICRVMPNIGVKLGQGVLAMAFNKYVQSSHKLSVKEILEPLGKTIELKEKDFNAVTALAGSGPGFISLILESLMMGGIAGGLSSDISKELVMQTVSATMELLKSGIGFDELRFLVSSPAGTSVAGLEILEKNGVRGSIIESIKVASERAHQLGSAKEDDLD